MTITCNTITTRRYQTPYGQRWFCGECAKLHILVKNIAIPTDFHRTLIQHHCECEHVSHEEKEKN